MRITKSVIRDLAIFMIGFGMFIGIVFPFFMLLFGVDKSIALSSFFVITCILAGAFVAAVNILLSRIIVIQRLKWMTEKMVMIKDNVIRVAQGKSHEPCDLSTCQLVVDSEDEIGNNASAFNKLVETLSLTMSGEELISRLDQETIVQKSLNQIIEVTHSTAGGIFVVKEGELVAVESYALKNIEVLQSNDILLSVAFNDTGTKVSLPDDIEIDGIFTTVKPKEILVEPLQFNGVRIGVVIVAKGTEYEADDHDKLGILTKSLSLALHNAIIHEQIRKLAAIDPLTGIFNRRFGLSRLKEEYARSIRTRIPMGIIILDLDYFKDVNDNYGHLAGDKVLISITKLIKGTLREGDVLMRYGGDEFLIILTGASLDDAYLVAEKIRHVVEKGTTSFRDYIIRITCSLGVASIPDCKVINETDLLEKADAAMYQSKESGRNKTTMAK